MPSRFDAPAGTTVRIPFCSYDAAGASVTLSGLAVTDIEIYKDGSPTQRASDSGYSMLDTDGIDFDGITGLNGFSIDLSDNTTAGFFAVGSEYWVVISAVTIDGQTVNFVAAWFRIVAAESVAGKPKVDVDAFGGSAGTFTSGRPEVNTTHAAGTAWGSGAITAGALAADAITASKVAADVGTEIGTAVWGTTTRLLTAGTNIVLAKDAGVTGFNDPTASQNADELLDRANGIETGLTPRNALRVIAAGAAAKLSGAGTTTETFRNAVADSKNRMVATVDQNGNRSAITYDLT